MEIYIYKYRYKMREKEKERERERRNWKVWNLKIDAFNRARVT